MKLVREGGGHQPVLLEPVMRGLRPEGDGIYVDATFGRGGHSAALLERLGPQGRVIALDRDPEAVAVGEAMAANDNRLRVVQSPFAALREVMDSLQLSGRVRGLLFDLGVSSPQLDTAERGFSFRQDGPLDMRMDPTGGVSAEEWLHHADEGEIRRVLKTYGEERFAKRIANSIVRARQRARIVSTAQLADLISEAAPVHERDKHPATRSFQAIRIFINRELEQLQDVLGQVLEVLAPGGRLAVISFHSLEDRMVKRFMRDQSKGDDYPPDLPVTVSQLSPKLRLVGRAVRANEAEVAANPRARSAVLRVAERLA